ncbi:MAG: hypothetical protein Q8942_09290 [Bacillota bacterium]|nr:hypothetical protein [Bacillota bacterium]
MENKVITNKNTIAKVIEFLNSLALTKDSTRPKDAVYHVNSKHKKGDIAYSFQYGRRTKDHRNIIYFYMYRRKITVSDG